MKKLRKTRTTRMDTVEAYCRCACSLCVCISCNISCVGAPLMLDFTARRNNTRQNNVNRMNISSRNNAHAGSTHFA